MIYQMASLPRPALSAALIGQQFPPLGPRPFSGESVLKRQESLHVSRFRSGWRTKVKLSLYDGLDKHWGKQQNPTEPAQGLYKNSKAGGQLLMRRSRSYVVPSREVIYTMALVEDAWFSS